MPFVYSARFIKKTSFESRQNKCFAVGTVFAPRYYDFIEYFGKGMPLHPMRDTIYNKKNEIREFIDCYICSFESARNLKNISKDDSLLTKLAKKYLPFFLLSKILPNYKKEYFKFNIVEEYNQYKIFVSPEEIVGLPSINAIEGMACGCAFIGVDDSMYTDIGFKAGVNYIAYKINDLEDLINQIKYYFEHQQELKKIADNGYEFARSNFSKEKVADVFWNDLEKLLKTFNNGNAEFRCSFKK